MTQLLKIIDELEAKAKAATPGPWHYGEKDRTVFAAIDTQVDPLQDYERCNSICAMSGGDGYDFVDLETTGQYIAACSPDVILQLCTALREATELAQDLATRRVLCDDGKATMYLYNVPTVSFFKNEAIDIGQKARAFLEKWNTPSDCE